MFPLLLLLTVQECAPVTGPFVTAGDLARVSPPFRKLPAELRLCPSPRPGLRRVLGTLEQQRMLRAQGTSVNTPSAAVCIERKARTLSAQEVAAVIRAGFGAGRNVEVDVLEVSRQPVDSEGTLQFAVGRLPHNTDPTHAITWNGSVDEAGGGKQPVWAKVRLREQGEALVALRDLRADEVIDAGNVEIRPAVLFPKTSAAADPRQMFGRTVRRAIASGTRIEASQLAEAPAVRKGDALEVEVLVNQTSLVVGGTAESNAAPGQRVAVSTPFSPRPVQAIVKEKGHVVVSAAK